MKLCIYHGGCTDGVAAAWALYVSRDNANKDWRFHPGVYQEDPPEDLIRDAEQVLFVDFSYKAGPMADVLAWCGNRAPVGIIDHHRSAIENLRELRDELHPCVLDETACGALLTWRHFHTTPVPSLLSYIDRRDRFDLDGAPPDLDEVITALRSYAHECAPGMEDNLFALWTGLMTPEGLDHLRRDGVAIDRYYQQRVAEYVRGAQEFALVNRAIPLRGAPTLVRLTNCPFSFASDVGHKLAQEEPLDTTGDAIGGCYWVNADSTITFSLRSNNGSARLVAEAYGGGGHPNAAGFKLAPSAVNLTRGTLSGS